MDRLTKFAAKLYPRWWRERYGEEFAALLEDARPGLAGTLDILKGALTMQLSTPSPWKALLICAVAGPVIALASTFFFTPQYSSSAVISMQLPEGSTQTMADTINKYSQDALNRGALNNLMRNLNLYPSERTKMPTEDVLEAMKRNIRITLVDAKTPPAFEIRSIYPDPVAAQKVVNNLVSSFIDINLKTRDKEAYLAGSLPRPDMLRGPTLQVLDSANLPTGPVFPLQKFFAAAGLVTGLFVGGLAALVFHFLRKRKIA